AHPGRCRPAELGIPPGASVIPPAPRCPARRPRPAPDGTPPGSPPYPPLVAITVLPAPPHGPGKRPRRRPAARGRLAAGPHGRPGRAAPGLGPGHRDGIPPVL